MSVKLPDLAYAQNALEPYISETTIQFHYGKHHNTYVQNVNKLTANTEFENQSLEDIIKNEKQEETLDPEVMAVLNANLDLIEQAIGESRAAAQARPESQVAQDSLLQALRNKLSLLQNTIMLINEVRKGRGQTAYDLINKIEDSQQPSNPIGS